MFKPASLLLIFSVALSGCATLNKLQGNKIPTWVEKPPSNRRGRLLSFVGSASGISTKAEARQQAIANAMNEAAVFCGATVKGEFHSEESEHNGKSSYSVSQAIDIGGDEVTLRDFTVKEVVIQERLGWSGFDAYALMQWPRREYRRVERLRTNQALRALKLFLRAEKAEKGRYVDEAETALSEARAILGPMRTTTRIAHRTYGDTKVLWEATEAMRGRLDKLKQDRLEVIAVGVLCEMDGRKVNCERRWSNAAREAAGKTGFELLSAPMANAITAAVLQGKTVKSNSALRRAGYLVAVGLDIHNAGKEEGFSFASCGASMGVFDIATERTVVAGKVNPARAGHVRFSAAAQRACADIQPEVLAWLQAHLEALRPETKPEAETP